MLAVRRYKRKVSTFINYYRNVLINAQAQIQTYPARSIGVVSRLRSLHDIYDVCLSVGLDVHATKWRRFAQPDSATSVAVARKMLADTTRPAKKECTCVCQEYRHDVNICLRASHYRRG